MDANLLAAVPNANVALGLAATAIALYSLYSYLLPKPIPGIPYNAAAAKNLLGDAPDMFRSVIVTKEIMAWMAEQSRKLNAPLCQVFVRPFARPWLLLADWHEAQDVLLRRGKDFDRSAFSSDLLAPAGAFHIRFKTGDQWRAARKWLTDLMSPNFLNNVAGPAIYARTQDLVGLWQLKEKLAEGDTFSAKEDIDHVALDGILAFIFGEKLNISATRAQIETLQRCELRLDIGRSLEEKYTSFPHGCLHEFLQAASQGTAVIEQIINSPMPNWTFWWMKKTGSYKDTMCTKDVYVRKQVRESVARMYSSEPGEASQIRSAVDHIVRRERMLAEKQDRQPDFDGQQLIDEIFGNVVAAHDTTSSNLIWILKYLTDMPHVQDKVRTALHKAYPEAASEGRQPTAAELVQAKVPYLDAVVEEALRLSPISVTREALHDTELLGHHIPKGTVVFLLANGASFLDPAFPISEKQRSASSQAASPNTWDESVDLRAFYPERWLRNDESGNVVFDPTAGPQLAFGMGSRGCFGKKLAYLEARIIVTMIAWNFELLPVDKELSGYGATDGIAHRATQCYVKIKSIRR
ncbi:cytochrome P450 [Penicillium chermesinum]|uniref:Cytochrome P450 n=1 Tax=Penicillium chermesinum TaxID=63820 RepID=A0A9W9NEN6_9EURO|nr:cytochrome P450 [Penicillium chermesinum]KAJ5217448.1 cytochrome P450 [Penicillium chermesinum]